MYLFCAITVEQIFDFETYVVKCACPNNVDTTTRYCSSCGRKNNRVAQRKKLKSEYTRLRNSEYGKHAFYFQNMWPVIKSKFEPGEFIIIGTPTNRQQFDTLDLNKNFIKDMDFYFPNSTLKITSGTWYEN